ncbi:MAG: aminotransferase class I/II-fold pyridoxal phosphate-dependent enzyme [Gemmatimonadaceae bacterium]|nr:aminotransferase class I/II-fold pyridoxal phosphate-dependent enzyme [Gemmatimonadaceae bacterium]
MPRTARMLAAMRRFAPRIVVVVAPGNPRGEAWTVDELTQLADAAHERRCLLVIDQSYNAFLDRPLGDPALPGHPAVLHLRSLTKDFAIAGLRAAFAIGPAAVIRALEARRAPWSASAPAQAAAVACCEPEAQQHVVATTRALRRDAADFARSLREAGIGVHETQVHWVLCSLSTAQAHRLEHQHGIRVRTLDDHLLTGLARIVAPVSQQRTEVVHAIAAVHRTPIAPLTDSEPS